MGSFTMCTSPLKFKKTGIIQLAVKYSDHEPTAWVHKQVGITFLFCLYFKFVFLIKIKLYQPDLEYADSIEVFQVWH